MPIIDELITLLGFDADTSGAELFESAMGGVKKVALAVGTSLLAAEAAVVAYTSKMAASTNEMSKFSDSFGVNSDRLQQFEFAASVAGGSAEGLRGDIVSLTKSLASPIPGQFNQGLFLLGINVRKSSGELKSADEVLLNLADRFEGMSSAQAQILASQAGLSEGTLRFVRQGRAEIERLSALATSLGGVLPPEALKSAENYTKKLSEINLIIGGVGKRVSASLLPAMTEALDGIEKFVLANKELLQEKITEFAEGMSEELSEISRALGQVISWISRTLPSMGSLSRGIDLARLAASALIAVGAMLAISFAPAIATAAAVTAGVLALSLVIDDLIALIKGDRSVIGSLFDVLVERFPAIQGVIDKVSNLFKKFAEGIGPLLSSISLLFSQLASSAGDSTSVIGVVLDGLVGIVVRAANGVVTAVETIVDVFSILIAIFSGDFSTAADIAADRFGKLASFISDGFSGAVEWVGRLIGAITGIPEIWKSLKFELPDISNLWGGGKDKQEEPTKPVSREIPGKTIPIAPELSILPVGPFPRVEKKDVGEPTESISPAKKLLLAESAAPSSAPTVGRREERYPEKLANKESDQSGFWQNLSDIGNSIGAAVTKAFAGITSSQVEMIRNFNPQPISAVAPSVSYRNVTSNQQVKGGDTTVTNNFNINGAQSPQAVAQAISAIQGRRQMGLATSVQVGAYPGME